MAIFTMTSFADDLSVALLAISLGKHQKVDSDSVLIATTEKASMLSAILSILETVPSEF